MLSGSISSGRNPQPFHYLLPIDIIVLAGASVCVVVFVAVVRGDGGRGSSGGDEIRQPSHVNRIVTETPSSSRPVLRSRVSRDDAFRMCLVCVPTSLAFPSSASGRCRFKTCRMPAVIPRCIAVYENHVDCTRLLLKVCRLPPFALVFSFSSLLHPEAFS